MGNKLYVIGMGPGSKDLVHPAANELVENSDVLIGGRRNLKPYNHLGKETVVIGNNLDEIYKYIDSNMGKKRIAVLASGDPGLYSIMTFLKEKLPHADMEVIPGISSLQYLCGKLHLNWNDMVITSVHGRQQSRLFDIIKNNKKTAIFSGGEQLPDEICRKMAGYGLQNALITVGENLSYTNERIISGTPEELGKMSFDSLALMIVQRRDSIDIPIAEWQFITPGIPDHFFVRGNVPMTKEEIRAAAISKLRLKNDSVVYDIGAGTGSVSIECGLLCRYGQVYAIEKDCEGIDLIEKNTRKFGVQNVNIINGEASGALAGLPRPDRIFIGGTGGNMAEILDWINTECTFARVVANTVTIESTYEAIDGLKNRGFGNIEIVNFSISRSREAGGKHLMATANPIYIISAEKETRGRFSCFLPKVDPLF